MPKVDETVEKMYEPNYARMAEVLETPKQTAVVRRQGFVDGAVDMAAAEAAGAAGLTLGLQKIACDIRKDLRGSGEMPDAVLFVCACGWGRRVIVETEKHFSCERPEGGCSIYWSLTEVGVDEYDELGRELTKPTEVEVTGKKGKAFKLPRYVGRARGRVVREEMKARAMAGKVTYAQPQMVAKAASPATSIESSGPVVIVDTQDGMK